jgi:autoinducer 2-degrading protein
MQQIALIVEIETHSATEIEFDSVIRAHARACLDEEPGCLRFEILRPLDDGGNPIRNRFIVSSEKLLARFDSLLSSRKATLCNAKE